MLLDLASLALGVAIGVVAHAAISHWAGVLFDRAKSKLNG